MGGSKSQTVGYQYFAGLMVAIGNPIEQLLDINPAEKGWIMTPEQKQQLKAGHASVFINQPNLFGGDKKEGGWVGLIDVYVGGKDQSQSEYLKNQITEDMSAYPFLSYLVFSGVEYRSIIDWMPEYPTGKRSLDRGFQLVSMSGMMKEFLLWVKRTRIKNDGSTQWYERNPKGDIVCEIDATFDDGDIVEPTPVGECTFYYKYTNGCSFSETLVERTWTQNYQSVVSVDPASPHPKGENIPCPAGFSNQPQSSCVSPSEFQRSGYYHFDYKFGGSGMIVVNFEFKVPNAEYAGEIDQYIDFYCNAEYSIDKKLNKNLYVYTIRMRAPANIIATWNVKSAYYKKDETIGLPWYYEYGLAFMYFYQEPYDSNFENKFFDINPIHKIREILTDYTAMGKPESEINDENFRFMADRLYKERLGISWCIQQKSCKEALEELEYHIEGGVRINRQTGLYEVILFRDDLLDLDDDLHFDESNIKSFQPNIINAEDQINAVNVSFYDRENIKDSSFSLSDVGSFHTIDHENAEDLKFPYFMNRRNAEMVANWKLKQLSTMAWKGTFTTGKYEARKLNKYDVVLLSWKSKNIVNLPVRVMNINLGNGRDNTVTLDFVEVVPYSNISYSSINVDPNPNPILPPQFNSSIVFEMPYLEAVQRMGQTSVDAELANNPEIGYLMAAAIKPQNNSLNALLYTDGGTGIYAEFEEVGVVEYCAACYLDQNISQTDTSFAIKSVKDLSRVKLGTLVQVDDELLVYEDYDTETKVLTVKRGALDTIPKPHLKDAVLYFWDDSSGLDSTSYVDGEIVKAQVLTTTPSGIENLDPGNIQSLEIVGRANRPYPPANVKINGEYWLDEIENDLVLTWVDRNRVQQTGGDILGWFDSGVTLESGVTYKLTLVERDEIDKILRTQNISLDSLNTYTFAASAMNARTRTIEIDLKSLRDGFESYQSFNHIVELSQFFSAPYDLTVEYKND
ncbi:phage tail protein [Acinetobacter bereziniae]|uniref:phage tail protein n=1 Tax=Acinetobacter bereziniae TaxID=106648 RepID=UPI0012506436|nr:phage tail protein [Acinetobacter bereziniae]